MPKYYVNVEDPFDPKQYEVYAETKKDAERIAEKKNPHTPLRWTRVKTEAEKKNDDGLLAAAGAVVVAGLATYYTGKGAWYGVKGGWWLTKKMGGLTGAAAGLTFKGMGAALSVPGHLIKHAQEQQERRKNMTKEELAEERKTHVKCLRYLLYLYLIIFAVVGALIYDFKSKNPNEAIFSGYQRSSISNNKDAETPISDFFQEWKESVNDRLQDIRDTLGWESED